MKNLKSNKISIVSGGFDPLHVGHVDLFNRARELSDALFVILNSDLFLFEKKSRVFMPFSERKIMVESIKGVDLVIPSIDTDNTVCKTLEQLSSLVEAVDADLLFCNGGDRTNGENTPEHKICEKLNIETVYGLGDKIQSSSWLTK
jgi:D-beta-D-heptose 7-phosphate kinase/D-beta-D-heptose 1-phosphate adenosyltransferase